jgi:cytochrome c biogenesis protein CcmG/thiol:disulfide interchange protein DsbE
MTLPAESGRRPRRLAVLIPLVVFVLLTGVFLLQLLSGRDGRVVPSALIGQPAPQTSLAPLDGLGVPGVESSAFAGKVTVINIFASWCAPCREEHPVLLAMAQDKRYSLIGLNYKDQPEDARRFLGELGNPFTAVGSDPAGRAAIEWGVYGVPETFIVGKDGTILHKHVGPLNQEAVRTEILPIIEKGLAGSPSD